MTKLQNIIHLMATTVGREFLGNAVELSVGEFGHAGVFNIVHEVGGGVISWLVRAGVNDARAAVVSSLLSRGVLNTISTTELLAFALEGVVQAHPVTGFVGNGITLIVLYM